MNPPLGFWEFIHQRQLIYYRRFVLGQQSPWTTDHLLQRYHFTNIFRELDRGTQVLFWALDHHAHEASSDDMRRVLEAYNIMLYRAINNADTWTDVVGSWVHSRSEAESAVRRVRMLYDAGLRPLTSAWQVNGGLMRGIERGVIDNLWKPQRLAQVAGETTELEPLMRVLRSHPAIGKFAGFQVALDMAYRYPNLLPAHDGPLRVTYSKNTSDSIWRGPGAAAARLLSRTVPVDVHSRGIVYVTEYFNDMYCEIQDLQDTMLLRRFGHQWQVISDGRRLKMIDVEHALCEYDKYCRLSTGKGHQRLFRPRSQPNPNLVA